MNMLGNCRVSVYYSNELSLSLNSRCASDPVMRLRNLDLNLLLVFDAVLRERSVVRAAAALSISQPAVSHALNRLRHALKDQLFVRTPSGMMPTPRAEQLALPVRKALNELQLAVEGDTFDPSTANRRFTIAVNNYAEVVAVGPIAANSILRSPPEKWLASALRRGY
jgi:DNA-binding transcriptional LysR family regulator